jgi:hypothetical protein
MAGAYLNFELPRSQIADLPTFIKKQTAETTALSQVMLISPTRHQYFIALYFDQKDSQIATLLFLFL